MKEYECPNCGEWSEWGEFQMALDCPECQHTLSLDPDGEFVDGLWRDRTKVFDYTVLHERQMQEIERRAKEAA